MYEDVNKEIDSLKMSVLALQQVVQSMVIVHDGIQELEGIHLQTYEEADKYLKRRAITYRRNRENEIKRTKIEAQIEELKKELEFYVGQRNPKETYSV
jgi:hypothetical protein